MTEQPDTPEPYGFAVVANVRQEIRYGNHGAESKRGTKRFPPGRKLWLVRPHWDPGWGRVLAIGPHRGSQRLVGVIVPVWHLEDFRVRGVYSPAVLQRLGEGVSRGVWESAEAAQEWADRWNNGTGIH
ncbi:hypothetical protein [Streptomyces sp. NPDC060031]|uniref:hypothetical protein n=1 Tax=Streptomyces sp. NPDC060031 TaxID=3347043 RepID=UPI0036A0D9E4